MKRIMLVTTATISFIFSLSVSAAPAQVEDKVLDLIERIPLISPFPYGIGWSVTSGDFNGDGLRDAVASNSSRGVCLYYGNKEIPTTPDQILTDPGGEIGFGYRVVSAGDVNNDGFDELIVVKDRGAERMYLYMGTSQGLSNTPDIILTPPNAYPSTSLSGLGISSGNINGDEFDDIFAWGGSDTVNYFCVYFGSPSGVESSPNFSFTYPEEVNFANASIVGDLNNDGLDEVAVANYPPTQGFWTINIYHGASNSGITDVEVLSIYNPSPFLFLIVQLTSAGDLNGDGISDLLIGCQGADGIYPDEGKAYIFYGASEGLSDSPGVIIDSPYPRQHDGFGAAVDGIGDFNFDGHDDIVIGCPYGKYASIYNGLPGGISDIPVLTIRESGWLGWSVSHVGDMKGNGQDFIIVGEEFDNAYLYAHKDTDLDGIIDYEDNCFYVVNSNQMDYDADGIGDVCDNCPEDYNLDQEDNDLDGLGDVCDTDDDNDGFADGEDNCPNVPNGTDLGTCVKSNYFNPWIVCINSDCLSNDDCDINETCQKNQEDRDGDGLGDVCDNCPNHSNPNQEDNYPSQGNGIGDDCDCEGDFDCDTDIDGSDAAAFKADFGRSPFNNPCTNGDSCKGDFDCDTDVDGRDAGQFKEDFFKSNALFCPCCEVIDWCTY